MKTVTKFVASSTLSAILGGVIGAVVMSQVIGESLTASFVYNSFRQYTSSFERLAHNDSGSPRSLAEVDSHLIYALSLDTLNTGYIFDQISEPGDRAEALRITKLIDASPELQGSIASEASRNAAVARRCIVKDFSNPPAVVQCVRDLVTGPKVVRVP